jgi:hypothetical protein
MIQVVRALISVSLLWANICWSSTVTVIGPCDAKPLLQVQTNSQAPTLGDLTVEVFQQNRIPFVGDRSGIKSIRNSPIGDEALEVLSNSKMRSYGWCVSVNGVQPAKMPDEVRLQGNSNNILWFYAYSLYDRGLWKDYCTPSYKVRSLPVCQNEQKSL